MCLGQQKGARRGAAAAIRWHLHVAAVFGTALGARTGGMWLAYGVAHRMLKFDSLVPRNCLSHPENCRSVVTMTLSLTAHQQFACSQDIAVPFSSNLIHVSTWSESDKSAGQ